MTPSGPDLPAVKDLLIAVPSRGRPESVARLWDAMQATCLGDTHLLVGLDDDDESGYERIPDVEYEVRAGLRGGVAWFNELAVSRTGQFRFIGALGDDFLPRTPGWDARIMEALRRTPFAYGNEMYPGRGPGESCCHIFCRSAVVTALGYLGPPALKHMFVDNIWVQWGRAAGVTYLGDVVIEHLHPSAGKAQTDDTYQASAALMEPDEQAWRSYCAATGGLAADIAKLKALT